MKFVASFRLQLAGLTLLFFLSSNAAAFTRKLMWDDELVANSDLIVIAHLKENRFEMAKDLLSEQPDRKVFFTTLVITRILEGSAVSGDLRVGLHDPNYPTVLGGPPAIVPAEAGEHPDASASIGVAAIMGTFYASTTDDIRQDHLWFLSTHPPSHYGTVDATGPPGLWFPEGVQPVKLLAYFQAIMRGDAKAVAAFDDQKGRWPSRARVASERIAAKQALLEHDPSARCDELLKIYIRDGSSSSAGILALKEIMDCGEIGASTLIPVFVKAGDHALEREPILHAWQEVGYKESTPFILSWLRDEEDWWDKSYQTSDRRFATQEGPKGGWAYNDQRSISFRSIDYSIRTLDSFHSTEAYSVIQRIRNEWSPAAPFPSGNDFLKTCDDALTDLR